MKNNSPFLRLLTPSWVSALFIVIFSVGLTAGVIGVFLANTSDLQQYLTTLQQKDEPKPLTMPGQVLVEDDKPALLTSWPLMLVWGLTGLVVYSLATYAVQAITESVRFRQSLGYVNARPKQAVTEFIEHIILRGLASFIVIILLIVILRKVVPYCILAAHAAASDLVTLNGLEYTFVSAGVMAVSLHVLTIFVRLSLGRTRVVT
ncbi:MAG: hypothetical protein QFB86_02340 [Patescibacteria group bacterium]|nr:hypothetical protein [Patescibacteria group bacterium]